MMLDYMITYAIDFASNYDDVATNLSLDVIIKFIMILNMAEG